MIIITWLCPWYTTEAVEIYTDHPSYETKHPKRYKTWKILSPDTVSQMENSVSGLKQSQHKGAPKTLNEWPPGGVRWPGHQRVLCLWFILFVLMCVYTHPCRYPWRAAEDFEFSRAGVNRGWQTSWGRWELNTTGLMPEQQVLLTSATSHWPSFEFKLGCHPQAVSFVCMAIC